VQNGAVVGVRSATRAAAKGRHRCATSSRHRRQAEVPVLAEGCLGHLTGAAIREFGLADGRGPQVWELCVKEVWKVPKRWIA